jgi:hypothetical protein
LLAPLARCAFLYDSPGVLSLSGVHLLSGRWATPFSHLVRYVRKHLVEVGDVVEETGSGGTDCETAAPAGVVITKAASRGGAEYDEDEGPKRSADKVRRGTMAAAGSWGVGLACDGFGPMHVGE